MGINGKSIIVRGVGVGFAMLFFLGGHGQGRDSVTLRKLLVDYFDAVSAKNFVQLDTFTTKDFVLYEDGSVWNNDSVFHNIQYHQPFSVKFTLTDFHIFVDAHSAEARYHSHPDFVVLDTVHFSIDFLETATFRRTAAGWKIHSIHLTGERSPVVVMPGYYRRYDTVRFIPEHYRERLEAFKGEPMHRGGVIMLGNSITEFADWKRLLGDSGVVNRGIAGDNTFGMLDRLSEVIARRPKTLFVEAGVNDIGQGVPVGMIAGNIGSIVQYVRVRLPGTRVYVMSPMPANDRVKDNYPDLAGKNEVIKELGQRLREGAGSYGYIYVDVASRVMDGSGKLDERYGREDGLHLNETGYGVYVKVLKEKGYL